MGKKIKIGSRVRIREEFLKEVCSYQVKSMNYKPLVGKVVKEIGEDRYGVDFRQGSVHGKGILGDMVRVHSQSVHRGEGFPGVMLEEVRA